MSSLPVPRLSPRQAECLRLVYRRKSTKEIAAELNLAVGTVNTYLTEATQLLGARNRRDASEIFAAMEAAAGPDKVQPHYEGVSPDAQPLPDTPPVSTTQWRRLLPLRMEGVAGNELDLVTRLAWILALAIAVAIGFGMLSVGLRVFTDLVRGFWS